MHVSLADRPTDRRRSQTSLLAAFRTLAFPVVACGLLVPVLLGFLGGSATRLAYPAYAALVGLVLFNYRREVYPGYCIALFAISPFVRRVVDYNVGFAEFNPVLLAPYLALLPCLLSLVRQMGVPRPQGLAFRLLTACVVYGAFLALLQARVVPAIYEAFRWILPVALAAFIIENRLIAGQVRTSLVGTLAILVPLIAAYGVAQYFRPQPWDVVWLQNVIESSNATSFGRPEAYQLRVFSTLNSPGSLAMFLALAIPLLIAEGSLLALAGMTGVPALALTIVRGGWIACAIGLLATFVVARAGKKITLLGVGLAVAALGIGLVGSVQLAPEVANGLGDRLNTFSEMGSDQSAQDRLDTYGAFFDRLAESPLGEGFGANASALSTADKRDLVPLDSAILEAFITFGPIVGTMYFIAFGTLFVTAYRSLRLTRSALPGYFGTVCALTAVLPLGSNQLGELGVIAWTALGLLIATAEAQGAYAAAMRHHRALSAT